MVEGRHLMSSGARLHRGWEDCRGIIDGSMVGMQFELHSINQVEALAKALDPRLPFLPFLPFLLSLAPADGSTCISSSHPVLLPSIAILNSTEYLGLISCSVPSSAVLEFKEDRVAPSLQTSPRRRTVAVTAHPHPAKRARSDLCARGTTKAVRARRDIPEKRRLPT